MEARHGKCGMRMKWSWPRAPLWLAAVAIGALALAPRALAIEPLERWYVLEMNGERAGWMRFEQGEADNGLLRTTTELKISIGRAGVDVTLRFENHTLETPDGEPVSLVSKQQMGFMPTERLYRFDGDEVHVTVKQGDRVSEQTIPAPEGGWLPPAAAARFVEQQLEQGAQAFTYRTIDPSLGLQIIETTSTVIGETFVEALGKRVPAVKWKVEQSAMPGVETIEYVDERGAPIRTDLDLGGISMTVLASEKEVALADIDPAEIMVKTLVRPSRPIEDPRETRRATYLLRITGGDLPDLPDTGSQDVQRIDDASARLTVRADQFGPAETTDQAATLGKSTMIDPSDRRVRALVAEALDGLDDADDAAGAEALRRFVHAYIEEKNLGVGLATASEVCRTKEGDCTEHGVLLAAMLRAAGIPSRVASGLIYVDRFAGEDDIFGYHMWTQALLEIDGARRWVDLDATLPPQTPYDAAHVTLSTSTLAEGEEVNSMAVLASVIGQLSIEVVEIE